MNRGIRKPVSYFKLIEFRLPVKRFGLTRLIYTFLPSWHLMCLFAKTWSSKLWLWEFKEKSIIKENLHVFFRNRLNSNYMLLVHIIQKCVFVWGGIPELSRIHTFCWREDRMDPIPHGPILMDGCQLRCPWSRFPVDFKDPLNIIALLYGCHRFFGYLWPKKIMPGGGEDLLSYSIHI